MKSTMEHSRRALLRSLGLGLGALPLLGGSRALGADVFPRRLLVVVQTGGTIASSFFPGGSGRELAGLPLPPILAPLDKHRGDVTLFEKLELKNFTELKDAGSGHDNYSLMFTGAPGIQTQHEGWRPATPAGPSFDQHIAAGLIKQGRAGAVPKLHLGVQPEDGPVWGKRCFWRDKGQPITPENSPLKAAASIFGGPAMTDDKLARVRAERRSMLDFVGRDLGRFAARLGAAEREQIDAHLTSLREIERQLGTPAMPSAACGGAPTGLADDPGKPDARYRDVLGVQLDLAVAALRCNVAPVVTVQLTNGGGGHIVFSWLGLEGKGQEGPVRDFHDIQHRPGTDSGDKVRVDTWYMEQLASLLTKMKAVKEGGGTMLDNTAVLWANHMGDGSSHASTQLPWILAGRCGGALKTGQIVRRAGATPVNGILVALANAMGVPTETFGDARFGGEMGELRA